MKRGFAGGLVFSFMLVAACIAMAQPALAACSACAARSVQEPNMVLSMQGRDNATPNTTVPNITTTGSDPNGTAAQLISTLRERITNIIASHVGGTPEDMVPVVEMLQNRVVYRLNNTVSVMIAENMRLMVKPVDSDMEHIKLNGTTLIVHNVTNPALQVQLKVQKEGGGTEEKTMTITRTLERNRLNLTIRNMTAFTNNDVVYDNGTIYIARLNKTIELKTLPDMVKEKVREAVSTRAEIRNMELGVEENEAKYVVKTTTRKNILGFIPADVEEEVDVDAETGNAGAVQGPWWGFLAW